MGVRAAFDVVQLATRAAGLGQRTDAQLLAEFRVSKDPAAFEALVRRHGPVVLAACRTVLRDESAAEDAFQAAFVALYQSAPAIRNPSVAGWLFRVARRAALRAKRSNDRRAKHERAAGRPEATADPSWREAVAALYEELDRLPEIDRQPLVLCYLEGLSRDEAARRLGWTLNEVRGRLERSRSRLRQRLQRRGITLSAGLLAAVGIETLHPNLVRAAVAGAARPTGRVAGLAAAGLAGKARVALALVVVAGLVAATGLGRGGPPAGAGVLPPAKDVPKAAEVQPPDAPKDEKAMAPPDEGPKGERIAFAGRVVDPAGKPVKGARLYLFRKGETPGLRYDTTPRTTSDSDGRFRFEVSSQDYPRAWWLSKPHLVAAADGFGLALLPVRSEGTSDAEVRLTTDLPIKGRVVNLEGKPVAGARVRVLEVMAAATDDLTAWLKKAEAGGWDEMARIIGNDFPRYVGSYRRSLPALPEATTGADGTFTVAGIGRERVVMLSVERDGIATARLTVLTQPGKSGVFPATRRSSGEPYFRQPFDYVATPDQPFEGRVTDLETGAPIAGVTVSQWWSEAKTDQDGRYRLTGLRPGPTALDFHPGPDTPYHVRSVAGGAKDNIRLVRLDAALRRAPWITGKVIDERTKEPVAGARVSYKADKGNRGAADYFEPGRSVNVEARTGPDGSFRLAGIPGRGWLFVHRDTPGVSAAERQVQGDTDQTEPPAEVETSDQAGTGMSPRMYQALVAVDIDPKAPKAYTITLDCGVTIPVTLTDPAGKPVTGAVALGLSHPYYQWSKPLASEKLDVPGFNPDRPRVLFFYHPDRELGLLLQPKKGDAGPWTVALQPLATVTGTLVLPDGKPYPNADLTLSFTYPGQRGPAWLPDHSAKARFKTDAEGRFRFTKVMGDVDYVFWYRVYQDKFNTTTTLPFRAKPGETKDLGVVKTQAPRE